MTTRQTRRGSGNAATADRPGKGAPLGEAARPPVWTPRRIVLLGLMLVPLVMAILLMRHPADQDIWLEMAFYVFGVPIVVVNIWEWGSIRVLERSSSRRAKD